MNKINEIVKKGEHKCYVFCPNQEFYDAVGINSRRWAKILKGEKVPTITEAKALANYFEVPVTDLID